MRERTQAKPVILYCLPGSETLGLDIESVVEDLDDGEYVVEEWSTHPPSDHLPSPGWVAEQIKEYVSDQGEVDEGCFDKFDDAIDACTSHLWFVLDRIAMGVRYRMADTKLAEHTVKVKDGKPIT